jgi:hypothetical protein
MAYDKLPDGTVFTMTISSWGNSKEYLAHIVAIQGLINQKGLDVLCKKLADFLMKLAGTLGYLHKSIEPQVSCSKEDLLDCKVEVIKTQEMLEEARKRHGEALAKRYKLLRNLLSGDLQTHGDQICRKMHKRDSWAGVNGRMITWKHPHLWVAFWNSLELHKITVFTADAAKKQWYYIQQAVRKPQRATVCQHVSCMEC